MNHHLCLPSFFPIYNLLMWGVFMEFAETIFLVENAFGHVRTASVMYQFSFNYKILSVIPVGADHTEQITLTLPIASHICPQA